MAELDRVRWHCRRGLLELDLIFEKFNRRHLSTLDAGQLGIFEELLELSDNELLDLLTGRATLPEQRFDVIVQLLRAA